MVGWTRQAPSCPQLPCEIATNILLTLSHSGYTGWVWIRLFTPTPSRASTTYEGRLR